MAIAACEAALYCVRCWPQATWLVMCTVVPSPLQVSRLVQNPATPERVRTWGARFLNLVLTQLGPSLVEAAGAGGTAAGAPGSADGPAAGDDGAAGPHTAGVQQSLEAARQGVEEVLGSHAAALFQRRVNLQEGDAENKLEKLCQGISFFLQQSE